jgi:putative FmdB family regulatory protein
MFKMRDFQCNACQHVFEDLIRPDDPLPPCEACGHADVTQLLSAPKLMGVAMADAARLPEDQVLLRRRMVLESKMAGTRPSERAPLQKEIESLTKAAVRKQGGKLAD